MKRRAFFQHAAAAIATVAIGMRMQAALPTVDTLQVLADGEISFDEEHLVAWKCYYDSTILNSGFKIRPISASEFYAT